MNEWKEFKKEHYQQKYSITYGQGMIDFAPESMDDVRGGSFRSHIRTDSSKDEKKAFTALITMLKGE